jgi:hypothetical protein
MRPSIPFLGSAALDVLFPRVCVHCEEAVEGGGLRHLCVRCETQLHIVRAPHCTTCGQVNII